MHRRSAAGVSSAAPPGAGSIGVIATWKTYPTIMIVPEGAPLTTLDPE
jgi:hypothetical protein